jgi:hypothetical protein
MTTSFPEESDSLVENIHTAPSPCVHSITAQRPQFIIGICILQVTIVCMMKHLTNLFSGNNKL